MNIDLKLTSRIRSVLFLTSMALFLLACESVPDQTLAQDNRFVKSANELSARNLAPGECGLFIWAGEARRRGGICTRRHRCAFNRFASGC